MATVYVYVMETMADWEAAHLMAELNSRRYFKKEAQEILVKTVAVSKSPVRTMGGLRIQPDLTLDELIIDRENVLILPGSDRWGEPENFGVLALAKAFLEEGALVAAICGATVALANAGLLDHRPHTSNGKGFLNMFCPEYQGTDYYVDEPAVQDGNLITAAGTGGILMAKYVLRYLDVMYKDTLDYWYSYFSDGDAGSFFAMMQSLQR